MLAACPAKTLKRIFSDIITALNRNFLDRICHIFNRNAQKATGNFFFASFDTGFSFDLRRKHGKTSANGRHVKRLILIGAKNMRKILRLQLAKHGVAIGYGKRATTAIASRPRIGTSAFRPDLEPAMFKPAN